MDRIELVDKYEDLPLLEIAVGGSSLSLELSMMESYSYFTDFFYHNLK